MRPYLLAVILLFSPLALAQKTEVLDCKTCHETQPKLDKSTHAALTCETCHDQVKQFPHPEKMAKPDCGSCHPDQSAGHANSVHGKALTSGNAAAPSCASCHNSAHETQKATTEAFKKAVPETCGMCHSEVLDQFKVSVHGTAVANGVSDAPVCTDCHGEHNIQAKSQASSPVNKAHIRETCARCHGDVRLAGRFGLPADRITTFDSSFHGLAAQGGSNTVANCASCHGFHNILPSSDAKSMTHVNNLSKTCGACHPGAGGRFALGTIHWQEGGKAPLPIMYVRWFYLGAIPVTLGLMFLHHLGDFLRKAIAMRFRKAGAGWHPSGQPGDLRMYGWERIQHALLAVSFIILGWTGFALKYPHTWWSAPLVTWEAAWPVRGTVHRVAAVVFVVCSLMHVVLLITNKKLRDHWLTLFPKMRDIREGFAMMGYNLGLVDKRPHISPHSYIEKVEYWAVVWGAFVMGATGLLLWFNGWAMQQFPKIWLDVATSIHFYEAVLACAAIVVWHFYTVIFDPEVYPMDTAWLTGRTVRRHEHAAPPRTPPASGNKAGHSDSPSPKFTD